MPATVYLIRHATPDWSRTDLRYDIPPGPPLTEQGEAEAAELGQFLAEVGIDKIYASPLERTRRTAEIAAEIVDIPVEIEEQIAEWRRGEAEADVQERCRSILESAIEEGRTTGPVALVSHGGPIRTLLQFIGVEQSAIDHYRRQFDRDNPVPPAGVWRITYSAVQDSWTAELAHSPKAYTPYQTQQDAQELESETAKTVYV